ncbi:magnesium/cobalt transporter CorA [Chlamydiota bacterium]
MVQLFKCTTKKPGLPPGTLVHVGEKRTAKVRISLIDYDENNFTEKEVASIDECFPFKDTPSVTWINIDGVHDVEIIEKLGKRYELHPLILEDILNTGQRPKFEDFDSIIFVVLKMLYHDPKTKEITVEQVSLLLGEHFVISFQEKIGDVFGPIRERIRKAKGRIRKMGADYLLYALIDIIVDHYFIILEQIGEEVEEIEEKLIKNPIPKTLQIIQNLKRDMVFLRKSIWPLREVVGGIQRAESKLIKKTTGIYLRDVYDHTIQVIDTVETFRDMVSGMLDIYLSSISNRMNEVMKVLTIFAAIFIPLTFIAGIYGMNFEFMPELKWKYGYFFVLGVMTLVAVGLLYFFKRKKWL